MKRVVTYIKELCQYVGIILLACGAAGWLIVRGKKNPNQETNDV